MLIQVINPNASRAMSELICEQLTRVKGASTELLVVNPAGAPAAIESALDEAQTIPPMLEIVRAAAEQGIDAIVIACFSDPGLDAAHEATRVPVVGIQEASMHLAAQLGDRFSVLTTLDRRVPVRYHAALRAGLERRLASCPVLDLPVLETIGDRDAVLARLVSAGREAVERDRADVLILGCAGLGDLAPRLLQVLQVPVIDPNAAGLKLAETLVGLGLSHSKARQYAVPLREPVS